MRGELSQQSEQASADLSFITEVREERALLNKEKTGWLRRLRLVQLDLDEVRAVPCSTNVELL